VLVLRHTPDGKATRGLPAAMPRSCRRGL